MFVFHTLLFKGKSACSNHCEDPGCVITFQVIFGFLPMLVWGHNVNVIEQTLCQGQEKINLWSPFTVVFLLFKWWRLIDVQHCVLSMLVWLVWTHWKCVWHCQNHCIYSCCFYWSSFGRSFFILFLAEGWCQNTMMCLFVDSETHCFIRKDWAKNVVFPAVFGLKRQSVRAHESLSCC